MVAAVVIFVLLTITVLVFALEPKFDREEYLGSVKIFLWYNTLEASPKRQWIKVYDSDWFYWFG